jgi:cyclic pyranopterin phosphate synthase
LLSGQAPKGDVLAVARVAGIQAAKKTPELIPLCHTITLTGVEVDFTPNAAAGEIEIEARVQALDRTGAEMEALTAVSVAALTIYDMLKAVDRAIRIERIALHEKRGGKSGHFVREP